jgi:hypothetical protein
MVNRTWAYDVQSGGNNNKAISNIAVDRERRSTLQCILATAITENVDLSIL